VRYLNFGTAVSQPPHKRLAPGGDNEGTPRP
jgi:hypothetical protein